MIKRMQYNSHRIDKELSFIYLEQIISIFLKNRILKK